MVGLLLLLLSSSCCGLQSVPPGRWLGGDPNSITNDRRKTILSAKNALHLDEHSSSTDIFENFAVYLQETQQSIIDLIESTIEKDSGVQFSADPWKTESGAGGITRVMEGGQAIEKGACSLTIIRNGTLTAERARNIQARQSSDIQAGDSYCAAALSMVLHSRNPMVPTFRSDVRIFQVGSAIAWFGGGADLTPYYLFEDDIIGFHQLYADLCSTHDNIDYEKLKQACDEYFYLPARSEHRGTGGIFFDDLAASDKTLTFVKEVAEAWMPSWIPIVLKRGNMEYSEGQKYWQKLRRGRYIEFNLLYDVRHDHKSSDNISLAFSVGSSSVSRPPTLEWKV